MIWNNVSASLSSTICTRKSPAWASCLGQPRGPQERVQLHTVEQLADVVPIVRPQMGDQLVASLLHHDTPIPEQVIEVPKISLSSRRSRKVLRAQQQTAEQSIDIPVPRGRPRVVEVCKVFSRTESNSAGFSSER